MLTRKRQIMELPTDNNINNESLLSIVLLLRLKYSTEYGTKRQPNELEGQDISATEKDYIDFGFQRDMTEVYKIMYDIKMTNRQISVSF